MVRELDYIVLDLDGWNKRTCDFCSNPFGNDNKAVCQIRTRSKLTDKLIANDVACESCRDRLNELPKCGNCSKLFTKADRDILSKKYICDCEGKEQEKELPILPHERKPNAFYERQINTLREENEQLTEEVDTHLDALEISEDWHKRQKQELLDRIKELELEVEKMKALTPQELINEIESYKEEVARLRTQLEKLNSQQSTQIEVKRWPWLKIRK
jgi:DNA repair exonuclease SbcCD ATPase subunit